MDDVQTEEGGGSLEAPDGRGKGDDPDGSSFSTSIGVDTAAKRKSMRRVIRQRAKYYVPVSLEAEMLAFQLGLMIR